MVNDNQNELAQSVLQINKSDSQSNLIGQQIQSSINQLAASNQKIESNRQLLEVQLSSAGKISQGISKLQNEIAFSDLQTRLQNVSTQIKN